jgi:hypothetical protein
LAYGQGFKKTLVTSKSWLNQSLFFGNKSKKISKEFLSQDWNLTKSLDPCALKLYGGTIKLYKGSRIMELKEKGLKLDACCLGLEACNLYFKSL